MAHKTSSFTAKILSGNKDEPASAPVTKAVSKISLPPPPTKKKRRQRVKNVRRHRKGKCTGFKPDLSGFDFEDKNPIVLQDSPAHDGSRSHTQCSCKGSEQIISREKSRTHRRTETRTHRQADLKKKKDPPPFLGATSVFFGKGGREDVTKKSNLCHPHPCTSPPFCLASHRFAHHATEQKQ